MIDRKLPLETQISLVEADLSYNAQRLSYLVEALNKMCAGFDEMYESPEKLECMERILAVEEDIDNLKEKTEALENWLVDVGARGWGTRI